MFHKKFKDLSFYIVAHADDWQLFMSSNAYRDLIDEGTKVVMIITTAGDAGMDREYWAAREEGCKSSVRFCIAPYYMIRETEGTRKVNNHEIYFCEINSITLYFLRLPDGNLNGNGFLNNYFLNLSKLKSRDIFSISALDHSTLYGDWEDFCLTLNEIVINEGGGLQATRISYLDPNLTSNDHPDHQATGCAVQTMEVLNQTKQLLFSGYECVSPEVISMEDMFWKVGMLAVYEKAVFDICGYSTLKEGTPIYMDWCFRKAKNIEINCGTAKILITP